MSESPIKLHCGNCRRDCTEDPLVQVHQFDDFLLVFCLDCEKDLGEKLRVIARPWSGRAVFSETEDTACDEFGMVTGNPEQDGCVVASRSGSVGTYYLQKNEGGEE